MVDDSAPVAGRRAGFKMGGLALALVLGVALYGVGWWQGKTKPAAEAAEYKAQVDRLSGDSARAVNRGRVIEARLAILEAVMALDSRNFGIAATHVQAAGASLGEVDAAALGVDAAVLASIREEIARTDLNVAADLAPLRVALMNISERLRKISGA